jgi:hypothetical protein
MKLRNKKTGEIWDIPKRRYPTVQEDDISFFAEREGEGKLFSYKSIAELKGEWEDYNLDVPLIKNEKVRKVVRAWWEAIPDAITDKRIIFKNNDEFAVGIYTLYCGAIYPETLERNKLYTIAELCGEEEE